MRPPGKRNVNDAQTALSDSSIAARRAALRSIAAAGIAGVSGSATVSAEARKTAAPPLDLTDPKVNLRALQKILASMDPRETVISFSAGRVYACISERPPIPLFGTHSIAVARALSRPDGSFLLRQHIVGFRTQFNGETFIDQFVNPVTREKLDLPLTDYHVNDSDYRLDGTYARTRPEPIRLNQAGPRPWSQADGIVALSDDASTTTPGPHQPKIDVVTRFAFAQDLANPRVSSAASWFSFSAVDPFRPWLKMTDPGLQLWHVYGRKVRRPSNLPAYIRQVADSQFPGLFELPHFLPSDV